MGKLQNHRSTGIIPQMHYITSRDVDNVYLVVASLQATKL